MGEATEKRYSFFTHEHCEFFPCHSGIGKEEFNCLFCYCPLYFLGEACGGDFTMLTQGIKDCSNCLFPHKKGNHEEMLRRLAEANAP